MEEARDILVPLAGSYGVPSQFYPKKVSFYSEYNKNQFNRVLSQGNAMMVNINPASVLTYDSPFGHVILMQSLPSGVRITNPSGPTQSIEPTSSAWRMANRWGIEIGKLWYIAPTR